MKDRRRARQLAAEALAAGDPTGWFERLYAEGERGESIVPWVDFQPSPNLVRRDGAGQSALVVGCGFGDDAEEVASWGFETTAFDISETAVRRCRHRFPSSRVRYVASDVLNPPADWTARFHFILESNTLQVLPEDLRVRALHNLAHLLRRGGHLQVICRGREPQDDKGQMPWPLTRAELEHVPGLAIESFDDFFDDETPPARRFRVLYRRPAQP